MDAAGGFDLIGFIAGGIFVLVHFFVWAQPFLVGFYTLARAFLWTARLIVLAPWGWLIVGGGISPILQSVVRANPELMESCILGTLFFLPIGLFLVPARRWEPLLAR